VLKTRKINACYYHLYYNDCCYLIGTLMKYNKWELTLKDPTNIDIVQEIVTFVETLDA